MENYKSLNEIYQNYSHPNDYGDKGTAHSYIGVYEFLFEPIRLTCTKLLEIGCFHGHSLRMWREYFPSAFIDSIEIVPELCFEEERIKVYHGDSMDVEFSNNFQNEYYDIIIDDGLHSVESQIIGFNLYFPKLKKGGIYVIEDISEVGEEFIDLHPSFTLYDLSNERHISDNKLVVYKK
jgi:hypothetical protein